MVNPSSVIDPVATIGSNPIFWSGTIGACVALFSAVILGLFNAWHSAREKKHERTMTLRKEIYLPLVGSLPAVWNTITKLPTTPQFDEKAITDFSAYANKLATVAETKTAILAIKLSTTTGTKFMELMNLALPAHEALNDIALAKEYRIKYSQKSDLVQSKIDEHLQSGKGIDSDFEALSRNLKFHHENSQKQWSFENEAQYRHALHTLAFMKKLVEIMPELDAIRVKLLLALRKDMGLRTSERDFEISMQSECARMVSSIQTFIADLENKLKTIQQK